MCVGGPEGSNEAAEAPGGAKAVYRCDPEGGPDAKKKEANASATCLRVCSDCCLPFRSTAPRRRSPTDFRRGNAPALQPRLWPGGSDVQSVDARISRQSRLLEHARFHILASDSLRSTEVELRQFLQQGPLRHERIEGQRHRSRREATARHRRQSYCRGGCDVEEGSEKHPRSVRERE